MFYVATITLILKPHKDIMSKEIYRPNLLVNIDVKTLKNISKPNTAISTKRYIMIIFGLFYECIIGLSLKSNQCTSPINENNHVTISIDKEKAYDRIQFFSMIKCLSKL